MPFASNADLPVSLQNILPSHAQDIFRAAFNNAWERYADPDKRQNGATQDDIARRAAWAAVKRLYRKDGHLWVEKMHH